MLLQKFDQLKSLTLTYRYDYRTLPISQGMHAMTFLTLDSDKKAGGTLVAELKDLEVDGACIRPSVLRNLIEGRNTLKRLKLHKIRYSHRKTTNPLKLRSSKVTYQI